MNRLNNWGLLPMCDNDNIIDSLHLGNQSSYQALIDFKNRGGKSVKSFSAISRKFREVNKDKKRDRERKGKKKYA